MQISVRCRCNVQRTIDIDRVGPWRLRCKQCGDVLYDPSARVLEPELEESAEPGVTDSQFQRWLHGSAELKVMLSNDGEEAMRCERHPDRAVVAACTRCSAFLCKRCLDRVGDAFVCAACIHADDAARPRGWLARLLAWFRADSPPPRGRGRGRGRR